MNKPNPKKLAPFIVALVAFILFGLTYCAPVLDGKVLQAGDITHYYGAAHEIHEYSKSEGRQMWWTNSMFGGMPSYQISGQTPANRLRAKLENISHLGFIGDMAPVGIVIAYLIGFFIMLLCFNINPWISIVGAIALTLSSYFMLIIPAGHITKANAICCLAPMIGGLYAIYRSRYWYGVPIVVFFGTIGLTLHPQMTYYIFMLIGIFLVAEIIIHAQNKTWKEFFKSTAVLLVSLLIVLGTKLSWFEMNRNYLKETMRGGHSELVSQDENDIKPVGLDFEYATAWSYGKAETLTLLIPDYMGGSSTYSLGKDSPLEQDLKKMGVPAKQARLFCNNAPTYWGEKSFTSGPVYVGAIICFLFILGLIIVKGTYKWALLAATCLSIALAWGHNCEWLSRLFFDYFPMYNKFRTVESILIVAEITIPLLGFLAVKELIESEDKIRNRKAILIAGGITSALCLIVAACAHSTNTISTYDQQFVSQIDSQIYNAILNQRQEMISSSALRSFAFVLAGVVITLIYCYKKEKKNSTILLTLALGAAILIDLIPIDKKYFGNQNFITKKDNSQLFAMQDWEKSILQDKSLDFRVLNLSVNTFNDARTSYRLKHIGGYSAVKLRRYQDLIDAHISKSNKSVIDMLNTKYYITREGHVVENPDAMGNAWFVDTLLYVDTPVQESQALNVIDLKTTAVTDKQFADALKIPISANDPEAFIRLDKYVPDHLEYTTSSTHDKIAVFSEIYYPRDWHLYIDGKEQEIARVNYVLRAAVIPAGKHSLVMEFRPDALKIDWLCSVLVILTIILTLGLPILHFVKQKE